MQQAVYFIFCLLLMSVPASYEGNIGARDFAPVLMSIAGVQSVFFPIQQFDSFFIITDQYSGNQGIFQSVYIQSVYIILFDFNNCRVLSIL